MYKPKHFVTLVSVMNLHPNFNGGKSIFYDRKISINYFFCSYYLFIGVNPLWYTLQFSFDTVFIISVDESGMGQAENTVKSLGNRL